jgi:hypothetical protein
MLENNIRISVSSIYKLLKTELLTNIAILFKMAEFSYLTKDIL